MDGVCATKCRGGDLRDTNGLDLSLPGWQVHVSPGGTDHEHIGNLLDQLGNSADRLLNGDGGVSTMCKSSCLITWALIHRIEYDLPVEIVKVDVVGLELLQRVLKSDPDVFGRAVGEAGGVGETELGGEVDVLALAGLGEPLANQLLVVLVGIRGVPEFAATLVNGIKELKSTSIIRPRSCRKAYLNSVPSSALRLNQCLRNRQRDPSRRSRWS